MCNPDTILKWIAPGSFKISIDKRRRRIFNFVARKVPYAPDVWLVLNPKLWRKRACMS